MRDEWIFDVLADLRRFALKNGLPAFAAQIDTAQHVAKAEIAARADAGVAAALHAGLAGGGRPN